MTWLLLTAFCFFVVFLPYEIYCIATGKPTLSRSVTDLSRRHPLVGFLLGAVMGGLSIHFFTAGMQCMQPTENYDIKAGHSKALERPERP